MLRSYLQREKPAALITAHNHVNVASIIASKFAFVPTKVIATIHTAMSRDDLHGNPTKKKIISQLCKLLYPQAAEIVAVSQAVADDTARYLQLPSKRIKVVHNPVISPAFLAQKRCLPEHPFFKSQVPVVLAVGRLNEQKDFFTLLRAFAILRQSKEARLIILGEGEDRAGLETLIRELKLEQDVSMPGFLQNVYDFMAHANLLVSSSAWEGLPTVIIEALALGTPVVATDCPGGTSEILEGGRYGKLVEVAQPEALAKAMLETLASSPDHQVLKTRGLDFSFEAAAKAYLKLLD
jgi:glycosyltransferase involved in cell wall biosynthesis